MSSAISRRQVVLVVLASMVGAMLAVLGVAGPATASHYRATQIVWHKHAGAAANEVEFHATASWRCSFFFSSGCPSPGTTFFADPIEFGDGAWSGQQWTVTASDSANDVFTAEMQATHTYATSGPYTAYLASCCRLSGPEHVNNPDGSLRAETVVNTAATTASPTSSISPIVDCALDAVCQFFVPGADADGQDLRWRFSTSSEAGSGFLQPGPPHAANAATIDPATGLYRWDTTGAALSSSGSTFYSTQVTIENLSSGGSVISRTAVDFFIRLSSNTTNQAPVFVSPTPADGTNYNVNLGDPVTFDVAATDPDAGDTVTLGMLGKPATATYSTTAGNPATGTFTWTADALGTVIITLTAQDQQGLGATQRSITINVAPPANQPPEVDPGGPYTGDEGAAIPISGDATDGDGHAVTTTWSVTSDAGNDGGAACVIDAPASLSTSMTCNDDGTYTLKLEGDDGHGGTDEATTTVTVGNLNPSVEITSPTEGALYPVGATVNLTADVDDPGSNDQVTCATTWDDGSLPDVAGESAGVCSASHTYTAAGVYEIRVDGSDGDGGSASDAVMIVVYDPAAGFVTGGGWIESAAGSYTADPSLSGRANFGFVSKYKKGAVVPEGQTEFQFHAGNFKFHSEAYQWLVVAGTKAQFKGTGAVNGSSGYGFLLTAYDGGKTGPDKFRIKVWQLSDGSTVYDNKVGSPSSVDSADPQVIGGGSIVIHK